MPLVLFWFKTVILFQLSIACFLICITLRLESSSASDGDPRCAWPSAQCVVGAHQMSVDRVTEMRCLCHHLSALLWSECGIV